MGETFQVKGDSGWWPNKGQESLGARPVNWKCWGAEAWPVFKAGGHLGFCSAGSLSSAPDSRDRNRKFGRIGFPESVTMKFSFQRTTYSQMSAVLSGECLGHGRVGQRNETKPCHGNMVRDVPRVGSAQLSEN